MVERRGDGNDVRYVLTPAGRELQPVVEALGIWGIRWIGEIGDEDLDPKLLLWDMHRNIDYAAVPPGRTVVQFRFPDVPSATRDWWLVIGSAETDVCDDDPGHPVAVTVTGSLRRMTEVWRGDMSWPDALRSGGLTIQGPTDAAPGPAALVHPVGLRPGRPADVTPEVTGSATRWTATGWGRAAPCSVTRPAPGSCWSAWPKGSPCATGWATAGGARSRWALGCRCGRGR